MFDYAGLIRLLERHISDKSDVILYVCVNKVAKKNFKKTRTDLVNPFVLTIDEIWSNNALTGIRFKDYKIIF